MNPADECLAFSQLVEQGADVEGIARRFGLTIRFVEGRLRLSALAPAVFAALGAGEISLDVAKAYAATPDQERQAYVFEQMGRGYGYAHPDSIRRMMTQATVSASDRRALFVGEDAYLAAGGRIEQDLFSDDSGARWLDVAILERLACEKLETLAAEETIETGLGWVRPTLERWIGYPLTEGLRRIPLETPPLSDEEKASVDALEAEVDELVAILEDEESSDEAREQAEAGIRELDARIQAIVDKPPVIADELKPQVGAFLMLDEHGRPTLDTGRFAEIPADGEASTAGDAPDDQPARNSAGTGRPAGLPQRLLDELAIQRRDILAVHVAANTALALDLATFLMIDRESGYSFGTVGSSLTAHAPADPVAGFKTPEAPATIALAKAREALDRSWTEGQTPAERFDAFRALPEEARSAWLGFAVARTLEATRSCDFHDHLGTLLGIDVARWWRPTGTNYFDRVPKNMSLAALAEVGGPELASRHAKAKKAELVQSCERIFAGDFIAEPEVKQAALAWVPEAMRFAPAADKTASDEPKAGTDPDGCAAEEQGDAEVPWHEPSEEIEEAA
jgi:ParB family chromosome partitioning protein